MTRRPAEFADRVRTAYEDNCSRFSMVKRAHDSGNVFRLTEHHPGDMRPTGFSCGRRRCGTRSDRSCTVPSDLLQAELQ